MALVKQRLYSAPLEDLSGALGHTLDAISWKDHVKPGQTVAVAVGSRGIDRLDRVVSHCLEKLKAKGLKPFIVPAMGSHGGGTADGQTAVLSKLGISESALDTAVVSDMAVESVGCLSRGANLFFSKKALEADYIVPINRVKPHTKFSGDIESGLCKILAIGLGKKEGATELHRAAVHHTFQIIEEAAEMILQKCRILFGLALIEDGYGKLSHLVDAIDMKQTYVNAIAAISPEKAAIPMHFVTDREAFDVCLRTSGIERLKRARIIRIKDTKNLELLQVSKAFDKEISDSPAIERVSEWQPVQFDENGNFLGF